MNGFKIAVASGKGGTGKSTVSTNLACLLGESFENVALLDCDVEEPNCHIFLKPKIDYSKSVYLEVPEVDAQKCIKCGKCAEVCQYNALAVVKDKVLVFPELCHSCGGCWLSCPVDAISQTTREVGQLESGQCENFDFIHGKTRIGEAMSPPLIKAVRKKAENYKLQVIDCPPGTSCPVIAAVDEADFVVMVTEPTPFGLYDLELAVDVMKKLKLPFGIVINKSSSNDKMVEDFAAKEGIEILAKIPDDRKIAQAYSKGELIINALPEFKEYFKPLVNKIEGLIK